MKNFLCFALFAVVLGTVRLPHAVMADGKPLPAGTYQVRLIDQPVTPATGQSPDAERWVEFVKGDTVVGRELASGISAADMASIAKGKRPAADVIVENRLALVDKITEWTGVRRPLIKSLVESMVTTCRRLELEADPRKTAQYLIDLTAFGTSLAMNYLNRGRFEIR